MPKNTKSPATGAGKSDVTANPAAKPAAAAKPDPQWAGKQGRGFAPILKPLRLPGKGRGG